MMCMSRSICGINTCSYNALGALFFHDLKFDLILFYVAAFSLCVQSKVIVQRHNFKTLPLKDAFNHYRLIECKITGTICLS